MYEDFSVTGTLSHQNVPQVAVLKLPGERGQSLSIYSLGPFQKTCLGLPIKRKMNILNVKRKYILKCEVVFTSHKGNSLGSLSFTINCKRHKQTISQFKYSYLEMFNKSTVIQKMSKPTVQKTQGKPFFLFIKFSYRSTSTSLCVFQRN